MATRPPLARPALVGPLAALVLLPLVLLVLLQPAASGAASSGDTAVSALAAFSEDGEAPTGRDEPIQLVRRTKAGTLELVPEGLQVLRSFSGVHHTVAVVGPFHSGKSFMLNKLMGRTRGFDTGGTVNPTTEGIYVWGRPLVDGERSILLLDTEGLAAPGNTADYDAKIFAMATLLSNHLLYNSVRIIDESSMEYLEVLARRARLFNANVTTDGSGSTRAMRLRQFPGLTWVVQNFFQRQVDGETPDDWLARLMDQQAEAKSGEFKYAGLRDIFPQRYCRTMFMPAGLDQLFELDRVGNEELDPRYRDDVARLVAHLSSVLRGNEKAAGALSASAMVAAADGGQATAPSGRALAAPACEVAPYDMSAEEIAEKHCDSAVTANAPRSGAELAQYLTVVVEAINAGRLAEVPSLWQLHLKQHIAQAREQVVITYRADMHMGASRDHPLGASATTIGGPGALPPSEAAFKTMLQTTRKRCLALFRELIFDLASDSVNVYRQQLQLTLDQLEAHANDAYHRRVHDALAAVRQDSTAKMAAFIGDLTIPQPSASLQATLKRRAEELSATLADVRERFPTKVEEARGFLAETLQNQMSAVLTKNGQALQEAVRAAHAAAVERYNTVFSQETASQTSVAYTVDELERMHAKAQKTALATWEQRTATATAESFFRGEKALYLQDVADNFANRLRKNEAQVEKLLRERYDVAYGKAEAAYRASLSHMPLEDADLATKQARALAAAVDAFVSGARRYAGFAVYATILGRLESNVKATLFPAFERENVRALAEKVKRPLERAYRRARDVQPQYWLKSSFLKHAAAIAGEEIGNHLSAAHKKRVIDRWVVSTEAGSAGVLASRMCFPAASTVEKEDGSLVRMDALQIGDSIRVGPDAFSPVYFFARRDAVRRGGGGWR